VDQFTDIESYRAALEEEESDLEGDGQERPEGKNQDGGD
jgi:hypothetical protein